MIFCKAHPDFLYLLKTFKVQTLLFQRTSPNPKTRAWFWVWKRIKRHSVLGPSFG
ncbi:hypothetical protein BDW_06380 [Bdellovibrio bacteriovorus W]|nr:hypothetical protein BDW_06380 [Bdellovibrio bacteriovorus W]